MLASRLHPDAADVLAAVAASRGTSEEVLLPAAVVREVMFGLWRKAEAGDDRFTTVAHWFTSTILGPQGLRVLDLDVTGQVVAARLRARVPTPPSSRRPNQSKPEHRVGWVADIEIAATAWRWALPLATRSERDFTVLAHALSGMYPGSPPLEVRVL